MSYPKLSKSDQSRVVFPLFSFLFNYRAAGGIVRPRSGLPFGLCTGSGVLFLPFEFQKKVSRRGESATIPFEKGVTMGGIMPSILNSVDPSFMDENFHRFVFPYLLAGDRSTGLCSL